MQRITHLKKIADDYDGFILDVWGCLHNGEKIYPPVLDCLQQLKAAGKKVYLLSNSPSRVESLTTRLEKHFGITPDLYTGAYNSGEATYEALRDRDDEFHARLGSKFYFVAADYHLHNFDGLPYEQTSLEAADFIILSRTLDFNESIEDFESMLQDAAMRQLPLICANPDRMVGIGDTLFLCPGTIASLYETMGGGAVFYHGKPYPHIYERVQQAMSITDKSRLVAIGDGLETDIRGGNTYGIDTVLLTCGIHDKDINYHDADEGLERLCNQYGAQPSYVMPMLAW